MIKYVCAYKIKKHEKCVGMCIPSTIELMTNFLTTGTANLILSILKHRKNVIGTNEWYRVKWKTKCIRDFMFYL